MRYTLHAQRPGQVQGLQQHFAAVRYVNQANTRGTSSDSVSRLLLWQSAESLYRNRHVDRPIEHTLTTGDKVTADSSWGKNRPDPASLGTEPSDVSLPLWVKKCATRVLVALLHAS